MPLLSTLCIKPGFCLPPLESEKLVELRLRNVEEFTRTVFVAEGLGYAHFSLFSRKSRKS
jgi:hypothetical protein